MKQRQRFLLLILVILACGCVIGIFTGFNKLGANLIHGNWFWVFMALFCRIVYYIFYSGLYQSAFYTMDLRNRFRRLFALLFESLYINVVSWLLKGTHDATLFVDEVGSRREARFRVSAGTLFAWIANSISASFVIFIGVIVLLIKYNQRTDAFICLTLLLILTGGFAGFLLFGLRHPERLRRVLNVLQITINRLSNRLGRPPLLSENWDNQSADEFTEASMATAVHPRGLIYVFGLALLARLFDLVSITLIYFAFGGSIDIGTVIIGYLAGILVWNISPVPQGIGLVEAAIAITYMFLGVPAGAALTISLVYRLLSFWAPMFIGWFIYRKKKHAGYKARTLLEIWDVRLASLFTGLMGIINILSAITPALVNRWKILMKISPLEVVHTGRLSAVLAGFALLLMAGQLWRRKRVAWLLTIVILLISIFSHLLKGLDYEEAILAALLCGWLLYLYPHFHARSDPPSVKQGLRIFVYALGFTLAYGVLGFYLLDRHFSVNFGFFAAIRQTITMFTEFYNPGLQPMTVFGRFFADSIYIISACTTGYALIMLVRPVFVHHKAGPSDREQAQKIVEMYGCSSLARFTLFEDKLYFFSSGGSVISYVVKGRIALALGDPIGPETDSPFAILEYKNFCAHNDWQIAFYQAQPDNLEHYKSAGLNVLCIGQEAIVDLQNFTLEGKVGKPLRPPINHLLKAGYRTQVYEPPLSDEILNELRKVSNEWLTMVHGTEKRFSLGYFDDDYIRNSTVMVVCNDDGVITAFANTIAEYRRNEVAVDLMRRRYNIEPGTMEFLFVAFFQWAKTHGYEGFNLGLSALAGVGEQSKDPAVERALHYIFEHINQFYNFKGVYSFKKKFTPRWSPRYLIYPGTVSLPAVLNALIKADSGDDFLWKFLKHN